LLKDVITHDQKNLQQKKGQMLNFSAYGVDRQKWAYENPAPGCALAQANDFRI